MEKRHNRRPKVRCISSSLKGLSRSVSRLNRLSIARRCMKDKQIKGKIFDLLGSEIQHELTAMCSKKLVSCFRCTSRDQLEASSWTTLASEIENRAPTLHSLLKICTDVRRVTRPLKRVRRRTSNEIVRVVCASIILRHRNQEMNLLQKIISVILHRGGAAKQVSSIINHTNRCNNCI